MARQKLRKPRPRPKYGDEKHYFDAPGPGAPSDPNVRIQSGAKPAADDFRYWLRIHAMDPDVGVHLTEEQRLRAYSYCVVCRERLLDEWRALRGRVKGGLYPRS